MKWQPRNYVESVLPLLTTYAVIGHGAFHYPVGKPRPRFSVFYTIFLAIAFATALHYTIGYALTFSYDTVEEKLFFYMCYMHTFVINSTAAVSWYHYKKSGRIVERITAVDETLRELGADCRYNHNFRYNVGAIVAQIILVFTINTVDMMWIKKNNMTVLEMIWFNTVAHHPFHISSCALLIFSMFVRQIVVRFTITNQILETITKHGRRVRTGLVRQKKSQVGQGNSTIERDTPSDGRQKHLVQIMKQVHLELCGISRDLNDTYGVQIVLQLAEYFALLTGLIYDLYLNFKITGQPEREMRMGVLFLWFIVHFGKVTLVNVMCAKAVFEANRTSEIIHKSNALYEDPDFRDEINQFALQMMQNPLSFTPGGFFTLGNKFVRTMLGTITTYVVILIEMNVVSQI